MLVLHLFSCTHLLAKRLRGQVHMDSPSAPQTVAAAAVGAPSLPLAQFLFFTPAGLDETVGNRSFGDMKVKMKETH